MNDPEFQPAAEPPLIVGTSSSSPAPSSAPPDATSAPNETPAPPLPSVVATAAPAITDIPMAPPLLAPEPPLLVASPTLPPAAANTATTADAVTEPPPARVGWALGSAVVLVGLLDVFLSLAAGVSTRSDIGYRIGYVLGGTLLWPGIIIGLFSIGRRFRRPRARAIILLVTWAFLVLGHVGNLSRPRQTAIRPPYGVYSPRTGSSFNVAELNQAYTADTNAALNPTAPFNYRMPGSAQPVASSDAAAPAPEAPKPASAVDRPSATPTSNFDFSSGSDDRLIKTITSAQEDRYRAVVAAYTTACAEHPADARLALERVHFISYFADSEDNVIEGADKDLETAVDALKKRHPRAPETILYTLEHIYDESFEAKALAYEASVAHWPKSQAASYWLMRAQRANAEKQRVTRREFAQRAFDLEPTVDAALLLAQALHASQRDTEAVAALSRADFSAASTWQRKQRMDLWLALKRNAAAFLDYHALERSAPELVHNFATATELARAGNIADARAIVQKVKPNQWNAESLARSRFDFELQFGNKPQAVSAYRELRAIGLRADPLLRTRFALFLRFPFTAPLWTDFIGVALLALIAAALVLGSAVALLPVHYWSMHRSQAGYRSTWSLSPWGLVPLWGVVAITALVVFFAAWWFAPTALQTQRVAVIEAEKNDSALLSIMGCVWTIVSVLLLILIARARAWRLFGPGAWGWRKALGLGAAFGFGSILVAGLYIRLVPGVHTPLGDISPAQLEMMKAMYVLAGPWGLFALVAVFAPLFEEMLLRGLTLGALAKHIPWVGANVLQAATFAALHDNWKLLPFYICFGYVAGELVRRSGSLLPAIAMHATNNSLAVLAILAVNAHSPFLS